MSDTGIVMAGISCCASLQEQEHHEDDQRNGFGRVFRTSMIDFLHDHDVVERKLPLHPVGTDRRGGPSQP